MENTSHTSVGGNVVLDVHRHQIAKRICLRCNDPFTSAGIHNRICAKCTLYLDKNPVSMRYSIPDPHTPEQVEE